MHTSGQFGEKKTHNRTESSLGYHQAVKFLSCSSFLAIYSFLVSSLVGSKNETYFSLPSSLPPATTGKGNAPCRAVLTQYFLLKMLCQTFTKKICQFHSDTSSVLKGRCPVQFILAASHLYRWAVHKGTGL